MACRPPRLRRQRPPQQSQDESLPPATDRVTLPWLLGRLGTDPAYGSGPLATIVQDVLTLLIYLGFVSWLLL